MGRPRRLVGPHKLTGAHALEGSAWGVYCPFYPCAAPLRGMVCAAEPGATSPALTVKPGASGVIRVTSRAAVLQKREEGRNPSRPSH
jgi:hypothetical protein